MTAFIIISWGISIFATVFFMYACKQLNSSADDEPLENSVKIDAINERLSRIEELLQSKEKPTDGQPENFIKRTKASLRNPLRTYDVYYDNFKGKESNLYEPVKPKRKAGRNEVDLNDV